MTDKFDLQRFVVAQAPLYERVISELQTGRKRSHWMWFVFPQVAGLGHSEIAQRFVAYLAHRMLGPRLVECTTLINNVKTRTITEIVGQPDDQKFRSTMTLFEAVSGDPVFTAAIGRYYSARDETTLWILAQWKGRPICR
jgi:uncharacterized protein (DUF1810 family)